MTLARPERARLNQAGRPPAVLLGCLLCAAAGHGAAQEAQQRPAWVFEPSISLRETLTSNVHLSESGTADSVTEITPALRLRRDVGRIQGSLDYALSGLLYARSTRENTFRQSLSSVGRTELVERWAFLDASASISRQARSSQAVASDAALVDSNSTEVASLRISPSLRGSFGGWAEYVARLDWAATRTKDSNADSYSNGADVQLSAPGSAFRRLGWTLGLSHRASRFLAGSSVDSDRLNGSLVYGFGPELRLSLLGGREYNDVLSAQRTGHGSWGLGLRWTPNERSLLDVVAEHRYFGHSYSIRAEHRLARSVFSYTDTRDVSGDSAGSNTLRTYYDLLFDALAVSVPDPLRRAAVVDAYLKDRNLSRSAVATGGFLTTGVSLQRRQNLVLAFNAVRSTLLATAFRSQAEAVNGSQAVLADQPAGSIARQHGFGLSLSHRLSPLSALTLELSYAKSESSAAALASDTATRTMSASWTRQMPQQAFLSLSARRTLSGGSSRNYDESAFIANLTKRF